jgi:hypothetical protein
MLLFAIALRTVPVCVVPQTVNSEPVNVKQVHPSFLPEQRVPNIKLKMIRGQQLNCPPEDKGVNPKSSCPRGIEG